MFPNLRGLTDFIVDPIVDFATNVIDTLGLPGVFVLMLLESACIPVPSEAIMLFAGFNVSEGNMTLFGIVAAGVLGNVVGSWAADAAGYYGRLGTLEKNRLAGIARMPFWRFTVLTLLGCVPWVLMLGIVGREVGNRWEEWREYFHYGDYIVLAAIVIGGVYLFVRWRRGRSTEAEARGEAAAETGP